MNKYSELSNVALDRQICERVIGCVPHEWAPSTNETHFFRRVVPKMMKIGLLPHIGPEYRSHQMEFIWLRGDSENHGPHGIEPILVPLSCLAIDDAKVSRAGCEAALLALDTMEVENGN